MSYTSERYTYQQLTTNIVGGAIFSGLALMSVVLIFCVLPLFLVQSILFAVEVAFTLLSFGVFSLIMQDQDKKYHGTFSRFIHLLLLSVPALIAFGVGAIFGAVITFTACALNIALHRLYQPLEICFNRTLPYYCVYKITPESPSKQSGQPSQNPTAPIPQSEPYYWKRDLASRALNHDMLRFFLFQLHRDLATYLPNENNPTTTAGSVFYNHP